MTFISPGAKWKANAVEGNESKLKIEDDASQSSTIPAPTFNGRLNISDFAFTPKHNPPLVNPPRRSPRNPPSSHPTIPSPTKPSPPKRPLPSPAKSSQLKRALSSPPSPNKPTPSPKKRTRTRIAPAPSSTYAHLPPLPDRLAPNLLVVFIGLNPGISTSLTGHAYAHPSNLFWKLLHSSGITPRRCLPAEDVELPRLFGLGNTNIVARPTRNGSELTRGEMDAGVAELERKIAECKPEAVVIVGKSIWESVWRVKRGRAIRKEEFAYGWQEDRMGGSEGVDGWEGARVFVACSTSGLAASLRPVEKGQIWGELGDWVNMRRREKGIVAEDENYLGDSGAPNVKSER